MSPSAAIGHLSLRWITLTIPSPFVLIILNSQLMDDPGGPGDRVKVHVEHRTPPLPSPVKQYLAFGYSLGRTGWYSGKIPGLSCGRCFWAHSLSGNLDSDTYHYINTDNYKYTIQNAYSYYYRYARSG